MSFDWTLYEPRETLRYFAELSAIPRGSGNEKAAADYVERFAAEHGFVCVRNEANDVFIRRPASAGHKKTVLLQCHLDMVCEKNANVEHDFKANPIDIYEEDGWLRARGTTLGADNGLGVAIALALLADERVTCGLEAMFTTSEETGMDGANLFDYSLIEAKYMINLDSEDERELIIGCVGGIGCSLGFECGTDHVEFTPMQLRISGLAGGHSGSDIDKGRQNAAKLMARMLGHVMRTTPINLVSFEGGQRTNVIPRECEAVITAFEPEKVSERMRIFENQVRPELCAEDAGMKIGVRSVKNQRTMFGMKDTARILSMLSMLPNGVLTMKNGAVESSVNLGVASARNGVVSMALHGRSPHESLQNELVTDIRRIATLFDAEVEVGARYPGWRPKYDTPLQRLYAGAYREICGGELTGKVIHAGLECGVIAKNLPRLDMISVGPTVLDAHSPDERASIGSCARVYDTLLKTLENI